MNVFLYNCCERDKGSDFCTIFSVDHCAFYFLWKPRKESFTSTYYWYVLCFNPTNWIWFDILICYQEVILVCFVLFFRVSFWAVSMHILNNRGRLLVICLALMVLHVRHSFIYEAYHPFFVKSLHQTLCLSRRYFLVFCLYLW